MPKTTTPSSIMQATTSFVGRVGKEDVLVRQGDLAEADSPIVKAHPDLFRPAEVRFPASSPRVEQATAAPGEKRGA